jgi:hypothetical protein
MDVKFTGRLGNLVLRNAHCTDTVAGTVGFFVEFIFLQVNYASNCVPKDI